LSRSWTNSTITAINNSRPTAIQIVRRPALWYDPQCGLVSEWSGCPYDGISSSLIWSFKPDGNGGAWWSQVLSPSDSSFGPLNHPVGALCVATPNVLHSLGGALVLELNNLTGNWFLGPTAQWTAMTSIVSCHFCGKYRANKYAAGFSPVSQDSFTAFGEASHVPDFGQEGLLANTSSIPIHDIHSGQWYHQITTGNIPPGRSETLSAWSSVIRQ
jgi:hypothetical protein